MTKLSECAGRYELGDPSCDGQAKEKACGWRNGCKALKKYCKANSVDVDDIIQDMSLEEVEELIVPFLKKPAIRRRGKKGARVDYPDELWHLYEHFEKLLSQAFPRRVVNKITTGEKKLIVIKAGTIYSVDKLRTTGYISWYCKTNRIKDLALISLHFKTNLAKLTAELPVSRRMVKDTLKEADFNKLDIRKFHEGQFRSKVLRCGFEEVAILVELLSALAKQGILQIPER